MHFSLTLIRSLFILLSVTYFTLFSLSLSTEPNTLLYAATGCAVGLLFAAALVSLDLFSRLLNLRSLNIAALGLFFGFLLGKGILLSVDTLLGLVQLNDTTLWVPVVHASIYLASCYLAILMTAKAADEIYVSIPFLKLNPNERKIKDFIVDSSALADLRMCDIAATGVFDQRLLIPRFLLINLYEQAESLEETTRARARKALDNYKKLEGMCALEARISDIDYPEIKDDGAKLMRLARQLEGSILTADPGRTYHPYIDGIRIISFSQLSIAMKPLAHNGEILNIKVQRYGKEARQGVGYLEDGTMVVVNGGAEFIGATIRAQVLSVKHTSSGRMIFCNAVDSDSLDDLPTIAPHQESEHTPANYFAH